MAGVKPKNACKSLCKRLEILTLPYVYVLLFMNFILNNQEYFQTNSFIHSVITKNNNHKPIANLSCFHKSAYAGIKIFNSLPSSLTSLINKEA
jgi:hypothetical protein